MQKLLPFRGTRLGEAELDGWISGEFGKGQVGGEFSGLIDPKGSEGARSKYVKYAEATKLMYGLLGEERLVLDDEPGFYRVEQGGVVSLMGLMPLEGIGRAVERVSVAAGSERQRLLEATMTQFEAVPGLVRDQGGEFAGALAEADGEVQGRSMDWDLTLERLDGNVGWDEFIGGAVAWLRPDLVAAAKGVRKTLGDMPVKVAQDFVMVRLIPHGQSGLRLETPMRRRDRGANWDLAWLKTQLTEQFDITDTSKETIMAELSRIHSPGKRPAFGVAVPGGHGLIAQVKDLDALAAGLAGEDADFNRTDLNILHMYVQQRLLGMTQADVFTYTRNTTKELLGSEFDEPGYLFMPPTEEELEATVESETLLPAESIDVSPSLATGMVVWSLRDHKS